MDIMLHGDTQKQTRMVSVAWQAGNDHIEKTHAENSWSCFSFLIFPPKIYVEHIMHWPHRG